MPRVEVRVHEDVAEGLKEIAEARGVSVQTLVRELVYEHVCQKLPLNLTAPVTAFVHK